MHFQFSFHKSHRVTATAHFIQKGRDIRPLESKLTTELKGSGTAITRESAKIAGCGIYDETVIVDMIEGIKHIDAEL
jgi:hypothetical protein